MRNSRAGSVLSVLLAAWCLTLAGSRALAGTIERVSVAGDGTQANGDSGTPQISQDSRYVVFHSLASNLVPVDTNHASDVFIHDRWTGATELVSVATSGAQADWTCHEVAVSADGRYVAFGSLASNLVPDDTNGSWDVFVRDRQSGETIRASVASDGTQGGGWIPTISADGRYACFTSGVSTLVEGDTNGATDVFVHDCLTGLTTRVNVASDGSQATGDSTHGVISPDGRYVVFDSTAPNLVPGDTNSARDIFVHDRETGETTRVSVNSEGVAGNADSRYPSVSWEASSVSFVSDASNLVPDDANGFPDVFVHDRLAGTTVRASVASDGTEANNLTRRHLLNSMSWDGRFVGFVSRASNLVPNDTNNCWDAFVHDCVTGETVRVSTASDGTQAQGTSFACVMSPDGHLAGFCADAPNLVPGDTNGKTDVFIADPGLQRYAWLGFVPPMADGSRRIFRRGSTIPLKFRIAGLDGGPVADGEAALSVYYCGQGAPPGEAEVVSTAAGDWGDQFRYDAEDDLYIFNLSTKRAEWFEWWEFEAVVSLDDGQEFSQVFWLK